MANREIFPTMLLGRVIGCFDRGTKIISPSAVAFELLDIGAPGSQPGTRARRAILGGVWLALAGMLSRYHTKVHTMSGIYTREVEDMAEASKVQELTRRFFMIDNNRNA